jgi:hypothetical protein
MEKGYINIGITNINILALTVLDNPKRLPIPANIGGRSNAKNIFKPKQIPTPVMYCNLLILLPKNLFPKERSIGVLTTGAGVSEGVTG